MQLAIEHDGIAKELGRFSTVEETIQKPKHEKRKRSYDAK